MMMESCKADTRPPYLLMICLDYESHTLTDLIKETVFTFKKKARIKLYIPEKQTDARRPCSSRKYILPKQTARSLRLNMKANKTQHAF